MKVIETIQTLVKMMMAISITMVMMIMKKRDLVLMLMMDVQVVVSSISVQIIEDKNCESMITALIVVERVITVICEGRGERLRRDEEKQKG